MKLRPHARGALDRARALLRMRGERLVECNEVRVCESCARGQKGGSLVSIAFRSREERSHRDYH